MNSILSPGSRRASESVIGESDTASISIQDHGADPTVTHFDEPALRGLDGELARRETASERLLDPKDMASYPEGGLKAWSVVVGSFSAMVTCFGMMNSIGAFQAYIGTHQLGHLPPGSVGWIFSLYVALAFFCGAQVGPVFDAKGPRVLVPVGSILLILSIMLLGNCTLLWHFIVVFGVLGGFGTALIFVPAVSVIGHYFLAKRGNATGIAATGSSIGGIVFPLMLQSLYPNLGFAWATRILGFIFVFLLILANILIRSRLPSRPLKKVDLIPDVRIFRSVPYTLLVMGVFLSEWGLFIPINYISAYALDQGFPTALSYQLLAILNAGSFFGRWIPGYVADRIGRFNTMILTLALCLISTLAIWLPATTSIPLTVTYAAVFGFASGSNISLTPVCIGQLCKTQDYGKFYSMCYMIVSIGSLTGIPIAGEILSRTKRDYWGLIVFTGAGYATGLVCIIAARVLKVGWRLSAVF